MIGLGIIILLVLLGAVPVLAGSLLTPWIQRENADSMTFTYLTGILLMLCVMQIFSVPMTLFKARFSQLVLGYNIVLAVFVLLALLFRRKNLMQMCRAAAMRIQSAGKIWIFVVLAAFIPAFLLTFYTPSIYGDDTTYLTMVNDMVSSDTLYLVDEGTGELKTWVLAKYALSSYWTFLAYLEKMTGLHSLILCKTILPYMIVPMYYAVQGLFAAWLFRGAQRKITMYMLVVNLVTLFGGFSNYTVTYRLMTWIWQSKALLALVVLPFLFYYSNLIMEKRPKGREFICLAIFITASAATTLTGTGLAAAMVLVLSGIYGIWKKRLRIIIYTACSCTPALLFMYMYLKYDTLQRLVGELISK